MAGQFGVPYIISRFAGMVEEPLAMRQVVITAGGVLVTQMRRYVRDGCRRIGPFLDRLCGHLRLHFSSFDSPVLYAFDSALSLASRYMLFVYAFRRNKVEAATDGKTPAGRRDPALRYLGLPRRFGFTGGLCVFYYSRSFGHVISMAGIHGGAPFMLMFTVFLNIHHYFIDHAIWRGDNEDMRRHLFSPVFFFLTFLR